MSDWQERITRETAPAIQAEHVLRYHLAASLVRSAAVWADLGCGTGIGAATALAGSLPQRAVLVDLDHAAVRRAAANLALDRAASIVGDLTDPGALSEVGRELLSVDGERVVTCFEVVEHLSSFVPLLTWSVELAREHGVTFVLSVPNDAFWAIQNPYHKTAWSEGAFEELRRLLPDEQTTLRQVALSGSTVLGSDSSATSGELAIESGGRPTVASHCIVAFGPRHRNLQSTTVLARTDVLAQRRWERERESNLAILERRVAIAEERLAATAEALRAEERTVADQREQLRVNWQEFERWRAYIHELEQKLGLPLSGTSGAEERAAGPAATGGALEKSGPEEAAR